MSSKMRQTQYWAPIDTCRAAPINPLNQHVKLRLRQVRDALFRRRPWKVSALQNLVEQAEPLAVPSEKLDPVSALSAEAEDCARARRLLHHRFNQRGQTINITPHTAHSAGQIDSHIPRWSDHAASTQATSGPSSFNSTSTGTFRHRPFRSNISTIAGLVIVVDS